MKTVVLPTRHASLVNITIGPESPVRNAIASVGSHVCYDLTTASDTARVKTAACRLIKIKKGEKGGGGGRGGGRGAREKKRSLTLHFVRRFSPEIKYNIIIIILGSFISPPIRLNMTLT